MQSGGALSCEGRAECAAGCVEIPGGGVERASSDWLVEGSAALEECDLRSICRYQGFGPGLDSVAPSARGSICAECAA